MGSRGARPATASALLARWDALAKSGAFPISRNDDFHVWEASVTAFASTDRWLLVFELVGFDYASAKAMSWVAVVEDEKAAGKREVMWRATCDLVDHPRFDCGYATPDEAVVARAIADDYAVEGDAFAHLAEFVVEFEGIERTVRPSHEDYRLAGAQVPRGAYERNAIGDRIDLLRGAMRFGESEVWLEDPIGELELGEAFPEVVLVHRERGTHVARHLDDPSPDDHEGLSRRPSRSPLWQGMAAKIAGDPPVPPGPIALADGATQALAEATGKLATGLGTAQLGELTELSVGYRREVENIDVAARMPRLKKAYLFGSRVADLGPLTRCVALDDVSASFAPVRSLAPLASLARLRRVDVSGTEITELVRFTSRQLQDLRFSFTDVSDLSPLENAPMLSILVADGSKVCDLSPLASLPSLSFVSVAGTEVDDLSPLVSAKALHRLDVSFSSVVDLSILRRIPSLAWVQVAGFVDVSVLLELPNLREVSVGAEADRKVVEKLEKKGVRVG